MFGILVQWYKSCKEAFGLLFSTLLYTTMHHFLHLPHYDILAYYHGKEKYVFKKGQPQLPSLRFNLFVMELDD